MGPRKGQQSARQEQVSLGPQLAEGEVNFGIAHIYASFNDTFVHVTDLSGKQVVVFCFLKVKLFLPEKQLLV